MLLIVVQGDHSWHRNSLFVGFGQGGSENVRLAALNLEEDLKVDSGWSQVRIGDSENLGFHLYGLSLSPECHLSV